ncbi:hypothetical protein L7F22_007645 [Adiantum nelumboides]|nr:hypothetical protein [Adiantum nelumboides]
MTAKEQELLSCRAMVLHSHKEGTHHTEVGLLILLIAFSPVTFKSAMNTSSTASSNFVEAFERKLFQLFPFLMDSRSTQLSVLASYLDQAEARDRICRAIQYGSKFISGGMEGVAQQVDLSTGLARKVFRLLKSVNELEALVTRSEKSEHFSLVLLNKSKSCLMATFLALDNLVWAGRIGIFKNKRHTDLISNISLYFLLGAYACGSLAEFGHIVWKKLDERDKDISRVQPYPLSVMEEQPYAHVLGFIKSSLDVVVAVGLLQIAPKHVTPRITGACGTVTSLITCYELYRRASLKVKII